MIIARSTGVCVKTVRRLTQEARKEIKDARDQVVKQLTDQGETKKNLRKPQVAKNNGQKSSRRDEGEVAKMDKCPFWSPPPKGKMTSARHPVSSGKNARSMV